MKFKKIGLRRQANKWFNTVCEEWNEATENSVNKSTIEQDFVLRDIPNKRFDKTDITLMKLGTEDAIVKLADSSGKLCVLNYASYIKPGGGFINGHFAQEEVLCHVSNLYNVLNEHKDVYKERRNSVNKGLYSENFIYSPDIMFVRELYNTTNPIKCDVLTYAATCPAKKDKSKEYYDTWAKRIKNAIVYPSIHNVDTLILGAWGCGMFGNDPLSLAQQWELIMPTIDGLYKNVVYAIPDDKNYKVFDEVIKYNRIGE